MSLTPGTRLGVYEVTEQIGEGGMGQVFRATDTKLKRQVAIKVLPPSLAADHDRLARFQREAEVLASLNHPHIASIYGLEESDGVFALVMELVDGEDLSQRIARGAIPIDEALPIAKQIAEALEAAHGQNIIHRDLKPANIKVRADGTVKVLDFGLAKAMDPAGASSTDAMHSPTLSVHATLQGVILGTAAYMAPEQARGKPVDRRADIWAFGVVLYEMVVGTRPFRGTDATEILASVVKESPELGKAPVKVRRLLESCLEKDPQKRLRDVGDAWRLLEEPPSAARTGAPWPWVAAFLVASALGVGGWMAFLRAGTGAPAADWTLSVVPPPGSELPSAGSMYQATPEISPDGTMIVCRLGEGLQLRRLDSMRFIPLRGTTHAVQPFWAPDSQWIAFFADGSLVKMKMPDGAPEVLTKVGRFPRGGTWARNGTILFVDGQDLKTLSATGGSITPLPLSATTHNAIFPHFLPDGEHFVFSSQVSPPEGGPVISHLYLGGWSNGKWTLPPVLVRTDGGEARYSPANGGSILFVNNDDLYARKIDLAHARLDASPVLVESSVARSGGAYFGTSLFSVSASGVLAWRSGREHVEQLTWFDRRGNVVGTVGTPVQYQQVRLSPDERRIAAEVWGPERTELRILETGQSGFLTIPNADNDFRQFGGVAWRPDGIHVLAIWQEFGKGNFLKEHSTTGNPETRDFGKVAMSFLHGVAPDGTMLGTVGNRLQVERFEGDNRTPQPLVASGEQTSQGAFSPDGHWVAYASAPSDELFVQAFPISGPRRQVSSGSGAMPVWRADGKEIVYLGLDGSVYSVRLDPARGEFQPAERLFAVRSSPNSTEHFTLAVTHDDSRILFAQAIDQPESRVINVALHRSPVP